MNLNDQVWVQLNECGLRIYARYWAKFAPHLPEHLAKRGVKVRGGWTAFQLWDFAQIFGDSFRMGGELPLRTTEIRLERP